MVQKDGPEMIIGPVTDQSNTGHARIRCPFSVILAIFYKDAGVRNFRESHLGTLTTTGISIRCPIQSFPSPSHSDADFANRPIICVAGYIKQGRRKKKIRMDRNWGISVDY